MSKEEQVSLPQWLDNKLIQQALQNYENDDSLRIIKISTKSAAGKGDSYTSAIYRVSIDFTRKKLSEIVKQGKQSIIIKVAHTTSQVLSQTRCETDVIGMEIKMMSSTLVEMEKILGDTKLYGKLMYAMKDPAIIIMEDLANFGFRPVDRIAGLDLPHSLLAIRNLAKFHASSVALVEKDPGLKEIYKKGVYFQSNKSAIMKKFFINTVKNTAKSVGRYPKLGPKYEEKLLKKSENAYDFVADYTVRNDSEFNVINHGDFWINNCLFHYDKNGQVDNHIFVDFQFPVYKTPAMDLHYFMQTSLSDDVLMNQQQNLLEEYLNVLTMTMKRIGCKTLPPTMNELNRIISKYEIFAVFCACFALPFAMVDKENVKDFDEMMLDEDEITDDTINLVLLERLSKRLPVWDAMGLLDG